jgi:enediyne biosynthesis protein E4
VSATFGWLRRQLPGIVALALVASVFLVARPPTSSAADTAALAHQYAFSPMSVSLPGGYTQQTVRKVNKDYEHIDAWISSVGAAIAMNDLDGDGLANDLCIVDPRIDQVVVTPTPGTGGDRYAPFALTAGELPTNGVMAPMGCVPGDFNEDGRMDLLIYFWGRTPILHLARAGEHGTLSAAAFRSVELVPGPNATDGEYTGPQWNTNSATVADFDGDGHDDIYIGNYFPHGPVLDSSVSGGVWMNHSMSNALNGGPDYVFRWNAATGGTQPSASFQQLDDVLPREASLGWALASSSNDLDGDLLPELYLAHDFGPDRLLHNVSTPGHIKFALVEGVRGPMTPKSKVIGHDSFKGMGVDFGDLNGDGIYDMYVSNITTSFGIEESHFAFMSTAKDQADLRAKLNAGEAPWEDQSAPLNLAWSGWGWDVKIADFNNSGCPVIAQATGFVKGEVNRWAQLQELATANDDVLTDPMWWPRVREGDDVGGSQTLHFFAKGKDGVYVNIAEQLGLAVPVPTRGIATGDADGDGRLDFAVARQWDAPVFYHNDSPAGAFLGLRLSHEGTPGSPGSPGSPVVGAQVTVTTADGHKYISRVDGGSGHSGKRSHEVHIGLGQDSGPVQVHLQWRDRTGDVHEQDLQLTTGWHSLQLGSQAKESR